MSQTIVAITAKCNDLISWGFRTPDFQSPNYEGQIPDIGIGGGDYIQLQIDAETGKILNWKPDEVLAFLEMKEAKEGCPDYDRDEDED